MDWYTLLNPHRLQATQSEPPDPYRSPFQKDVDRITFCSAFRRLQDKTQVHPMPGSDYIRTRLTHSLEVSCVGRSIGTMVGTEIIARYGLSDITPADFGYIVSAACLAHDIGNPPFGHAGEDSIREWFADNTSLLQGLTPAQQSDFLQFEGNAQGFRTLVTLQNYNNEGGLQLTYATLGAFTKYPRQSVVAVNPPVTDVTGKKFGFFQSEKSMFLETAEALGLQRVAPDDYYWSRHPLAFLLEAADDICYTLVDFEDGYKLGQLGFDEVESLLIGLIGPQHLDAYREVIDNDKRIAYLRAKAIGTLVNEAGHVFLDNENVILNGSFGRALLPEMANYTVFERVGAITREKVYANQRCFQLETGNYDIIAGLLEAFCEAVAEYDHCHGDLQAMHARNQELMALLGVVGNEFLSIAPYSRLQRLTDYISGMTDTYALELFKRVQRIIA